MAPKNFNYDTQRLSDAADAAVKALNNGQLPDDERPRTPAENKAASEAIENERRRQEKLGISGYFGQGG